MFQKLIYRLKQLFPWPRSSGGSLYCRAREGIETRVSELNSEFREVMLITDNEGHVIYVEPNREYSDGHFDSVFFEKRSRCLKKTGDHYRHDGDYWGLVLSQKVRRGGFLEHKRKPGSKLDTRLMRALITQERYWASPRGEKRRSAKSPND